MNVIGKRKRSWREILNHFSTAVHVGMTATPKRDADTLDTYDYFGVPLYTYSLKQGIEDGFLAPYFIVRPILDIDKEDYTPKRGEIENEGKLLEQRKYTVSDFDRILTVEERQKRVASHLTELYRITIPLLLSCFCCYLLPLFVFSHEGFRHYIRFKKII